MVKTESETREFTAQISELVPLEEAGIPHADLARRPLDKEHLETLILSDPRQWPPILVTKTDKGYVLIDGYHRKEAATDKGLAEIRATCQSYKTEQDIIEACFEANLRHGKPASKESRSNYAYWLHITFPDMDQKEIARRAGVKQSTVSVAISRRKRQEAAKKAGARHKDEAQEHMRRTFRSLARDATRFADEIKELEEGEQRSIIIEELDDIEEREKLLSIAKLIEEILTPKRKR